MNGLDLDKLKSQWAHQSRKLDDSLTLDVAAVRDALTQKTVKAFRRHTFWQKTGMCFSSVCLIALLVFIINHWDEKIFVLMAAPLAMLALGEAITDFREWRVVSTLDFGSPMLTLSEVLDRVRDRRLRMTKWIFLTAILLWWPLVFVAFKGLFGVDLLPKFHPSFHIINTLLGLAFIPIIYWIMHFISKRYAASPGFKNFLEETAGKSWSRARKQLDARHRFEDEVATHGDAQALQRHEKRNLLSPSANASLQALKNRVLVSTFFYGALILLIGLFNAQHGGQWQNLVPGILLNFFCVAHMVSGITHRISLVRLDLGLPADEICDEINRQVDMRLTLGRIALALTPITGIALLQVLAAALLGLDLIGNTDPYLLISLLMIFAMAGIMIYRKSSHRVIYAFANILGFAVFKRSKTLTDAIKQAARD